MIVGAENDGVDQLVEGGDKLILSAFQLPPPGDDRLIVEPPQLLLWNVC